MNLKVTKCLVFASIVFFLTCDSSHDPYAPTEASLEQLLAEHATRVRIQEVLGKDYTWYEKGSSVWEEALRYGDCPEDVRKAFDTYPKLMFYTTLWQRTWIFLDKNENMQAYFVGSQ